MARNPECPTPKRTGQTKESVARKPVAVGPCPDQSSEQICNRKKMQAENVYMQMNKAREGQLGKVVWDRKETKGTSHRQIEGNVESQEVLSKALEWGVSSQSRQALLWSQGLSKCDRFSRLQYSA